jgi:hypothetical protein
MIMRQILAIRVLGWICVLFLAMAMRPAWAAGPESATTRAAALPETVAPAGGAGPVAPDPSADFSPYQFFGLLLFAAVLVTIVVLSIAFLVLAGGLTLLLLIVGVLSVTMLVGLLKRSMSAAAKVLIIQVLALCGIPAGLLLMILITHLVHSQIEWWMVLTVGIVAGGTGGALVGILLNKAISLLYQAVSRLWHSEKPVQVQIPTV